MMRFLSFLIFMIISDHVWGAVQTCVPTQPNNGYRFPIVLSIPPEFIGIDIDKFEAWSVKNGTWSQVAVQIDERNKDGSYVLDFGLPYTKGTDDGIADDNDELSIKGNELGQSFSLVEVPKHIQKRLKALLRLDVCSRAEFLGSVLIGWSSEIPAMYSWVGFFNPKLKQVNTRAYRYEFNLKRPMLVGNVFLKNHGREVPVFADSTFKMPIIPGFWFLPGTQFDETDFESEIESWQSGPVRSIVAVGAKLRKFFSIVHLHLFSELVFYEDYFQIPTQIEMIFDAKRFLSIGSGLAYILKFPKGQSWTVNSNLVDLPRQDDLSLNQDGKRITAGDVAPNGLFRAWGSRDDGSFLAQVHVDLNAAKDVPPPFIVRDWMFDDPNRLKSRKWLRGTKGNLGVFLDISEVPKGKYDFALDLMVSPRANDEFADFHPVNWQWQKL